MFSVCSKKTVPFSLEACTVVSKELLPFSSYFCAVIAFDELPVISVTSSLEPRVTVPKPPKSTK